MRLRWKRDAVETGLRATVQGTRGHNLYYGDDLMACVRPAERYSKDKWYWHTMAAKPYENTCGACTSLERAKEDAFKHVKAYMEGGK
jgi:hypothetical protein